MDNVLSQAEIDALLVAVQQDDSIADEATPSADAVQFDIASRSPAARQKLAGLEQLSKRFAEHYRLGLTELLGYSVDVSLLEIESTPYGSYLHSLYLPTSLNLMRMSPLDGTAMMVFDARLVFRLVEVFYGGWRSAGGADGRDFSATERRLIERLVSRAHADLEVAWQPLCDLRCQSVGSEINPSLATIVGAGDPVLVCRFQVDIEGGGGELHMCFPAAMLEPFRENLAQAELGDSSAPDPQWHKAMIEACLDATVPTRFVLSDNRVSLADIASLKVGDVVPLAPLDQAEIRACGQPLLRAKLSLSGSTLQFTVKGRR